MVQDAPEDILSASLESLYDLRPISFSTAGSAFTYQTSAGRFPQTRIELATPDTDPSNWSLHASSIWVSSLFIADHLEDLHIDAIDPTVHVLELGAGAGLPSILLACMYPHASVTVSDYPDHRLMRTLSDNVRRNPGVSERCRVVPHAWGTDVGALIPGRPPSRDAAGFDVVFAADTLWNPELHLPLIDTLCGCLKRGPDARVHLVAGLHTGRYTIQSFLDRARSRALVLASAMEREVGGGARSRSWDVTRAEGEDEEERRRWVVWMVLRWGNSEHASKQSWH